MTSRTFNTNKRSPEWVLWGKTLPGDESRTLDCSISTGNLWRERQEQFIQGLPGKEISHQLGSALDEDQVTLANTSHCFQDSRGADRIRAVDCRNLN